ncbi:glycoside hydrolase family 2 TIM barrel-domain containing protein [Flavicella sediminum]|uniref:glycoside hydrolase family 2 TIM barrel-domain containing protein n=1 Tax=Flavicella sediminum TaxID=2585141 RepID=UPI001AA086E9|nr:glycoside hydrolase family 2 TIM barrel-domain containing protein [Flavicella sediminum]
MKNSSKILWMFSLFVTLYSCQDKEVTKAFQRESDFNFDWKFQLQKDTTSLKNIPLTDADWRDVRLPHDWSVEASFDSIYEGCTGYLPGGVGVYQKHFVTENSSKEKSTYVLFDGVYNNAKFWLNGEFLGENPYGYSPVYFDISNVLKEKGEENILTVHVDHSRYADSRWYTGSGIYRNVKLVSLDKLHIPIWGTYITTPSVTAEKADVSLEIKVTNEEADKKTFTLQTKIIDDKGFVISEKKDELSLEGNTENKFDQKFIVDTPKLWDTKNPNMYKAVTSILQNGVEVDAYTTPFGLRDLRFDPNDGFFLNGVNTEVKGVSLHHDGGLVGTAVPKGVWRRRLQLLKEGGCNAIRGTHNPVSQEFLDLCDEMGFLVINELFDELDNPKDKRLNYHDRNNDYITRGYTEHFQKWAKSDLTRTMLRDRNHPSIFQWSIGNEIEWTYLDYRFVTGFWKDRKKPQSSGKFWASKPMYSVEELKARYDALPERKYELAKTAKRLNDWVKDLDKTRPTTANLIIPQTSHVSGYADAVDIAGYSYRDNIYDWAHKNFPNKVITGSEQGGTWSDWKTVIERPNVFSMYMWTGVAYMGESNKDWPQKSWYGDMVDLAGFKNQGWNYFKSVWVNEPHISLGTLPLATSNFEKDEWSGQAVAKDQKQSYRWKNSNTHWNYEKGEDVLVEVCSNYTIVELFLNGKSLGSRSMSECPDRIFRWVVPYQEGVLTAKAGFKGAEIAAAFTSASKPVGFTVTTDKTELNADGYDVAHLVVQLVDANGVPVKHENAKISFELEGAARMLGVDTGADTNVQDFQSDSIVTSQGRCLLIVQSERAKGKISVKASSVGFETQTVEIAVK